MSSDDRDLQAETKEDPLDAEETAMKIMLQEIGNKMAEQLAAKMPPKAVYDKMILDPVQCANHYRLQEMLRACDVGDNYPFRNLRDMDKPWEEYERRAMVLKKLLPSCKGALKEYYSWELEMNEGFANHGKLADFLTSKRRQEKSRRHVTKGKLVNPICLTQQERILQYQLKYFETFNDQH